ncbi:MAG: hybrid-cluster NAD(P)-dependent oxidoreductase [Comamonadaceae bacterium]|nr:hybrid-cluster NAD(P)-dependent oxidoreductase [Comamonadaceae bacterium]
MPNKGLESTPLVETSANLLFALFIYIADAEGNMSAREVQSLQEMIEDASWCEDADIKMGLENLRVRYPNLWKDYQQKSFAHDLKSILERIQTVGAGVTDPAVALASLRTFVNRLCLNPSPTLVRLGLSSLRAAKQKAQKDLLLALSIPERSKADSSIAAESSLAPMFLTAEGSQPNVAIGPEVDRAIWPSATLKLATENLWKRGKTPVICVAIIPETHDVKTFVFQAVQPVLFVYKPGQFVTLELPIEGKTVRRSYTISSSPSRPHAMSITVKRVPGGLVSNWLHDNMKVGFQFPFSGPHGEFSCFNAPSEKLLLIAGGSGVTPIMSMLRWLADTCSPADIVFINNIRTPADVIFGNELKYLGMRLGGTLKMVLIPRSVEAGQAWNGPVCRFSKHLLYLLAPDFIEREVFVCGPPSYMDAINTTLKQIGFPAHRYHQESFGGPAPAQKTANPTVLVSNTIASPAAVAPVAPVRVSAPVEQAPAATKDPSKVELVFSMSSKTVLVTSDDFILDVAEEHGIVLPSSCRAGNCGTCKVRKTEGIVEMDAQQALGEADLSEGYVLACVGRACSRRVVLEA